MARPNSRAHRRRHRSQGPWNGELLTSQREQLAKRYGVVSLCASAAGWVQMRCRECAAEVAVTARVCSGCGAPIVGQPPVVADTVVADTVVADTVVAAVSDAAGKAVPAGVAGQALPEPYVPGSGDRVPAKLRLVLAGYVGLAGGLFAGALTCATACCPCVFATPPGPRRYGVVRSSWPAGRVLVGAVGGVQGAQGAYPVFAGCSGGPAIHTRPR